MDPESLQLEENRGEVQDSHSPVQAPVPGTNGGGREISHVLTLDEIAALAAEEGQAAETLMNVVALIAKRFQTEVCSAYLLEPDRENLVLAATVGLRRECIGKLRMAIHEGLAGLVAEQVSPVATECAHNHPRFKYFSEAGEDSYQSFLGVPLIDPGVLEGVLVVQPLAPRASGGSEIQMLAERATPAACGLRQALISPLHLESTNRCRFIPEAWACFPATISRAHPISLFRSLVLACSTDKDIFGSASIAMAGSRKNTWRPMLISCQWKLPLAKMAARSPCKSTLAAVALMAKFRGGKVGAATCLPPRPVLVSDSPAAATPRPRACRPARR